MILNMGRFLILVITTIFSNISGEKHYTDVLILVRNFMDFYEYPNKMFSHVCHQKDVQVNFHKELNYVSFYSNFDELKLKNRDLLVNFNFIFLDMSCPESKSILKQAQDLQLFAASHHWLLLVNDSSLDFQSIYFPISSNVYAFERNYYGFSIKKIYHPSRNLTKMVQNFIGYWTRDGGYFEKQSIYVERQNRQLLGEKIKISYVVEDMNTVLHLEDYQYNILIDTVVKFNYALLQHLVCLINATKIEDFKQKFTRDQNKNNNFTDVIDNLTQDFDIAGTPIKFLRHRVDQFDFLAKTAKLEKKFIFRATPHSYISNVFTLPFDTYVWYSCFGLMAAIFFVAYLVVYWEWKDPIFKKYLSPRLCLRPDPVDIFLMEVGSAAQQGFESEPKSNSGRIVFIFTLISLMFLYTSFSASIVALLQSTTETLNSLENLLDSRIPVGFEENISMVYFEELNFEKKSREFYNKIQKPTLLPIEQGVKKVQDEFFAFYADTSKIYKYVKDWFLEEEKCGLREIPFKNTHVDYWLVIKKNSSYKDIFRAGMYKIHESGLRSREHRRLFTTKPGCDGVGGNFESVGLADSYGAFLVMGAGMVLSVLLFLAENMWTKYNVSSMVKLRRNNEDFQLIGEEPNKYTVEEHNIFENKDIEEHALEEYEFTI